MLSYRNTGLREGIVAVYQDGRVRGTALDREIGHRTRAGRREFAVSADRRHGHKSNWIGLRDNRVEAGSDIGVFVNKAVAGKRRFQP
jgi:hypothetical protein